MSRIKRCGRQALAMALALCMMLGLLPGLDGLIPSAQAASVDAFGISMSDWTNEQKAEAEAQAPFGTGYGTQTSILTRSELYVSMGNNDSHRRTGVRNWNGDGTGDDAEALETAKSEVQKFNSLYNGNGMNSVSVTYRFVETAAMDLNGTGKDEYIANLAYQVAGSTLSLFVTNADNETVAGPITVSHGDDLSQLNDVDTYEIRGSIAVAAGDFDGDGKDTIVVYIPTVGNDATPKILEYAVNGSNIAETPVSTISSDVFTLLRLDGLTKLNDHDLENQPMVSLVAEDTDKDSFDELVITAGMNDVDGDNGDNGNWRLGSQLFVYDRMSTADQESGSLWNQSYQLDLNVSTGTANTAGDASRVVWASSTVGNIIPSTDTTRVDYPEILAAGFVDTTYGWDIDVGSNDDIGVLAVRVNTVASENNPFTIPGGSYTIPDGDGNSSNNETVTYPASTAQNVICSYEPVFRQTVAANNFTKGGFYESDDVNSLLQVQAFAANGFGAEEYVFISGTVYACGEDGLTALYTPEYFQSSDAGAGSHAITNANVQSVTAGNFDGNDAGREQLLCATTLRQSGKNNSYAQMYLISKAAQTEADQGWSYTGSGYLASHTGGYYITLNAVDTDDDGTILTLVDVERTYSMPDVLAILEATPYFREIGDGDTGNGQTVYGTSSSSGQGSSNTFGFSVGVTVGYEADTIFAGGGWELNIDNSFNWETANTTTVEWSQTFANDTGENLVVVYRCPVVSYRYVDQNGEQMVVSKTGVPAYSMITEEAYNSAAGQYGLTPIPDDLLANPGDPDSYRETVSNAILGEDDEIESVPGEDGQTPPEPVVSEGWIQYSGGGTVEQSITTETEQESTFTYGLDVSFSAWGTLFGAKLGGSAGFQYEYSNTELHGSSVTKSGSVTGNQVDGYDFQWKFAAWSVTMNKNVVPVIGYLVQDVVAPPSPAQNLTVDTVGQDSVTLSWEVGERPANQYLIYRILDDGSDALVGAVDGSTTTYTVTGLRPGTTYTYVVRGVGREADGDTVESVNSSSVTARTMAEDAYNIEIVLNGVDEDGALHSSGASASLTANVSAPEGVPSISYQWQIRRPGNAGWYDLTDGADNENIGNVSGAKARALSLTTINTALNGGALRCRVAATTTDATPEYYYSDIVPLVLTGDPTETTLAITNYAGGTGTIEDPYTGRSGYQVENRIPTDEMITTSVPVTVENVGTTYGIYSYTPSGGNTVYVAMANDESGNPQYHQATQSGTGDDATYTVGDPLTPGETKYCFYDENGSSSETEYENLPEGFDGVTMASATDSDGDSYILTYLFADGSPATEYWYNTNDGMYYTRENNEFTQIASQPTGDLRRVYANNSNSIIVDEELPDNISFPQEGQPPYHSSSGNGYEIYTSSQGTYTLSAIVGPVYDNGLYQAGAVNPYADRTALTQVIKQVTEPIYKEIPVITPGTTLNLSASVENANSRAPVTTGVTVSYVITNTTTGVSDTPSVSNDGAVTWSATTPGLYQITAITTPSSGNTSILSSSDTLYYYAWAVNPESGSEGPVYEYRLQVLKNHVHQTSIQYDGQPVMLSLQRRTAASTTAAAPGDWQDINPADDYTYWVSVDGGAATELTASSYIPGAAGNYDFTVHEGNTVVASSRLTVSKVPVTLAPTWEGIDNVTTNSVPDTLSDITIAVSPDNALLGDDEQRLSSALAVVCGLYDDDGKRTDATGTFPVTLAWTTTADGTQTEAAQTIQSRYAVTLESRSLYNFSDAVVVYYSASENGTISGRYTAGTTDLPLNSGTSVSRDYDLTFTATPSNEGYAVDQWTINGREVTNETSGVNITSFANRTQNLTVDLDTYLSGASAAELRVEVSFANANNGIYFGVDQAGKDGTITAADSNNNPLTSGSSVSHGADVTFTAAPAEGSMVDHWTVDRETYVWPDTEEPYREHTLTLEDISANHTVTVTFAQEGTTTVTTSVVDGAGTASAAATISVTGSGQSLTPNEDGTYTVSQDTSLVFTANLTAQDNSTVREWQSSTDGSAWTTIVGSGGQTTLTYYYPEDANLYIRAVVVTAQSYPLSWNVAMQDNSPVPGDANATLTATSNGTALTSGDSQAAYIPVDFTLTLNSAYYVVSWSDNVTGSGTTARLDSLTEGTTVTVTIAKKPVITIEDVTGGSVTVTGTVNGEDNQTVANGSYVDPNTTITITAAPNAGYVVENIQDSPVNVNKENGSKTSTATVKTSGITVSAAFLAKPTVEMNSVTGGSTHVTATVDGMTDKAIANGGYVDFGTDIDVTLQPSVGYVVDTGAMSGVTLSYTDGTGNTTDDMSYTISDVQTNQAITPVWLALCENTVTYSVVDTNGADTEGGTNGNLTATGDRKGMTGYKDASLDSGDIVYDGSTVTFTAAPDAGYRVYEWRVDNVVQQTNGVANISNTLTLEDVTADTRVTVQFELLGDSITVTAGEGGQITSAMVGGSDQIDNITSGFTPTPGAEVVITAEPEPGYEVASWQINGEPVSGQTGDTFVYTAGNTGAAIAVTFQQMAYSVSWGGDNGTVTAAGYSGSNANIRGGTEVVFTAASNDGWTVSGWTVNGESVTTGVSGNTLTWTVPNGMAENPQVESYAIQAVFGRGSYMVTVRNPANATIIADRDLTNPITGGTDVTFTAEPAENYILAGWIVNGNTVNTRETSYTVTIQGATTVSAVIVPSHYNVTYNVNNASAGTISAGGFTENPASVAYGEDISFTAAPAAFYYISGWQVDGVTQEGTANQTTFTLSNVTGTHTVTVVFEAAVSYNVGYEAGANGTLSATSNGEPLTLQPGYTTRVQGGSTLVFTAAPDTGTPNYMVAQWTVNGTTITRENMDEYGMTNPHANVLTVARLGGNLNVQVTFTGYVGYAIPTGGTGYTVTDVTRNPADAYNGAPEGEIRQGGDVTFTVGLAEDYTTISNLVINGYDCITGKLTDGLTAPEGCESVSAVKNSNGSYTVTITGVNGNIDTDIVAHQLVIGGLSVPAAFAGIAELDTVEEIQAQLETRLVANRDGQAFYDIALRYFDTSTNSWVDVTAENFPANGVDVVLPYPEGTDSRDTFTIIHMLTTSGHEGQMETVSHTRESDGLHFHVDSLSPFAVCWVEYTAPAGGGGGGGGAVSTDYQITVAGTSHGSVTASAEQAAAGDEITITVRPDAGFRLDSITVADEDSNEIEVSRVDDTRYTFEMPDSNVTIEATFAEDSSAGILPFIDVDVDDWFYDAVEYVYENGLMAGVGDNRFAPDSTLTRGMMVTILWRLEESPAADYAMSFTDVASGAWYAEAVRWAASEGIVNGISATEFAPNSNITREQFATMLCRYAEYKGYDTTSSGNLSSFNDAADVSAYAVSTLSWAVGEGLVNGMGDNSLAPQGTATRAQAATMLMRFVENVMA